MTNPLQQFFSKGYPLTNDAKFNIVLTAAIVGAVTYYVLKQSEVINLSFAGNLMSFNNADPESAIESITAWIIKRAVDRRTTGENVYLIKASVQKRRPKILVIITERFDGKISLGEYKRKLKLIGIEVAQELNIALGPQYQPKPGHVDKRGAGLVTPSAVTSNPPYGLTTLRPDTVDLPSYDNTKMPPGLANRPTNAEKLAKKAKSHYVRAMSAVSNTMNTPYDDAF